MNKRKEKQNNRPNLPHLARLTESSPTPPLIFHLLFIGGWVASPHTSMAMDGHVPAIQFLPIAYKSSPDHPGRTLAFFPSPPRAAFLFRIHGRTTTAELFVDPAATGFHSPRQGVQKLRQRPLRPPRPRAQAGSPYIVEFELRLPRPTASVRLRFRRRRDRRCPLHQL